MLKFGYGGRHERIASAVNRKIDRESAGHRPGHDGAPPRGAARRADRGLPPVYIGLLFDLIAGLRRQGLTILIVEQNVHNVLRTADRAYVLKNGRIVMQGERPTLLADERLRTAYLL